ncbi:hypothetical protein BDN67DRAFT_973474 [Paxillus ammoniavirescens]|nr:hypothetical protein BDN67DRAFT_973474 [Paxillus ammoniavirescens]
MTWKSRCWCTSATPLLSLGARLCPRTNQQSGELYQVPKSQGDDSVGVTDEFTCGAKQTIVTLTILLGLMRVDI